MELKKLDRILREKTNNAIQYSRKKWKDRQADLDSFQDGATLTFLGTGGNPEAVISQRPRTGGFIIHLGRLNMIIDPGPGAILSLTELDVDLGMLNAIYISHGHVDHYAGVERIIEGMCWAMSARRGVVLGPERVFKKDKQISDYHQGDSLSSGYKGGPEIRHLKSGEKIVVEDATLTPITAYHGFENYGFILEHKGFKLGYTSDTNYVRVLRAGDKLIDVKKVGVVNEEVTIEEYRQDIKDIFSDVDFLIANVTTHNAWFHRHITTLGLAHLLKDSKVKKCFITHFNYSCIEPEDLRESMATYVQEATGVETYVAYDKLVVNLMDTILVEKS